MRFRWTRDPDTKRQVEVSARQAVLSLSNWDAAKHLEIDVPTIAGGEYDELIVAGMFDFAGGFGQMARGFLRELVKTHKVKILRIVSPLDANPFDYAWLNELEKTKLQNPDRAPMIVMGGPQFLKAKSVRAHKGPVIAYTMFEARRLHPDLVDLLNRYADAVIVPSEFNRESFLRSGVRGPIALCPLGVDVSRFQPEVEPLKIQGLRRFVYGYVGGFAVSKGMRSLVQGFARNFGPDDDATLFLAAKNALNAPGKGKWWKRRKRREIAEAVTEWCCDVRPRVSSHPHIVLWEDVLPDHLMPHLYANFDCMGTPSRREGFWLPGLEAAAMNIPIWNLEVGGHRQFMSRVYTGLVGCNGWCKADAEFAAVSPYYRGMEFPVPDFSSVASVMGSMWSSDECWRGRAKQFGEHVRSTYSWESVTEKLVETINAV